MACTILEDDYLFTTAMWATEWIIMHYTDDQNIMDERDANLNTKFVIGMVGLPY
jgi:hypothetical protein